MANRKLKCSKCGKEVVKFENYTYGFKEGKPFFKIMCSCCSDNKKANNQPKT